MDNTINTSSYTVNNYTNYCAHRLPCGVCQRTNSICPLNGGTWTPTWNITSTPDINLNSATYSGSSENGTTYAKSPSIYTEAWNAESEKKNEREYKCSY